MYVFMYVCNVCIYVYSHIFQLYAITRLCKFPRDFPLKNRIIFE